MKLWIIERTSPLDYDKTNAAVVVAATESEARAIYPDASQGSQRETWESNCGYWEKSPALVTAKYIGEAADHYKGGEVLLVDFLNG
ncbi:MAG: hypothetical protein HY299_09880 [Verrucomicrobia bacterium]|nr:hypothetical protein [Verrucomicrobiota bacterium]